MRATIHGDRKASEGGLRIGITVTDNNGIEHEIEVDTSGEIHKHGQDGYPDKFEERSMIDENEPVNHARRYAQFYVSREQGYDTIEWRHDPDRILIVALTIANLDTDAVIEYFGDLYDQVRSHFGETDRPVSVPDDAAPGHVSYQQDVYLGLEENALSSLTDLGRELNASVLSDESIDSLESALADLLAAAPSDTDIPDRTDLEIEAVSGVHVRWDDASGTYHHERHDEPALSRDPDARFDVKPFNPDDVEAFQLQLVRNLLCQVRDCYIEMGVVPPEPFRIKGLGKHQIATLYEHYDFYQRYHDPQSDIDWDALEPAEHRDERERADA